MVTQEQLNEIFQQFTPEIVQKWEADVRQNPEAQWNENNIGALLPFISRIMPRITKNQNLFGLSIVPLEGKFNDESARDRI